MKQTDNLEATEKAISKYPVLSDLIGHFILSGMIAKLTALEEFYRRAKELEARSLTPSGAVVEAATELLRLKDEDMRLKEIEQKDGNSAAFMDRQDYQRAKGPAWDALRAALASPSVEPTVSVRCIEAGEGDPDGVCLCYGPDNCWDRKPTVDEQVEKIIAAWKKWVEWTNDDLPPESSIDELRERLKALLTK
jgi:hypothetical protein